MNYMKMVCFTKTSRTQAFTNFIYKDNEEINELDKQVIVPYYMILEAVFQTAGRVAREYTNNKKGGYIVSFSNFELKRPILSNESVRIKADLISYNEAMQCFLLGVCISNHKEVIMTQGEVIIKQDEAIQPQYLNNSSVRSKKYFLKKLGF